MNQSPSHDDQNPVDEFSNCHAGILTQLNQLSELPALLATAERSRSMAEEMLRFFSDVVLHHHTDEERELFPAVLDSAAQGAERMNVQQIVDQLVDQHRSLETTWKTLEPTLLRIANRQAADFEPNSVAIFVHQYAEHAAFEEKEFLPLSKTILKRDGNHLKALAISLHVRHLPPPALYV